MTLPHSNYFAQTRVVQMLLGLLGLWILSIVMSYLHQLSLGGVCYLKLSLLFFGGILFWSILTPCISMGVSHVKKTSKSRTLKIALLTTLGILLLVVNQFTIQGLISGVLKYGFGCEDVFSGSFINPIQNNVMANGLILGLISLLAWRSPSQEVVKPTSIKVKCGKRESLISIQDILWVQSDRNCISIHVQNEKYVLYSSLKKFKVSVLNDEFVQIHRSTVVNRNKISSLKKERTGDGFVSMSNGKSLRYSRNFKANIQL